MIELDSGALLRLARTILGTIDRVFVGVPGDGEPRSCQDLDHAMRLAFESHPERERRIDIKLVYANGMVFHRVAFFCQESFIQEWLGWERDIASSLSPLLLNGIVNDKSIYLALGFRKHLSEFSLQELKDFDVSSIRWHKQGTEIQEEK